MPDAYALTEATYDRFNRVASRVLNKSDGGGPQFQGVTNPIEILQIQSATIGTYGYTAKIQIFDTATGTYADDAERPATVYVIDPAGGTFAASQFVSGMFAGYRGGADESVYVYVKPASSGGATDFSTGSASIISFGLGAGFGGAIAVSSTGSKYRGMIVIKTGSSPVAASDIVTVQLSPAFTNSIIYAQITPTYTSLSTGPFMGLNAEKCIISSSSAGSCFTIQSQAPLSSSTYYAWNYQVINT